MRGRTDKKGNAQKPATEMTETGVSREALGEQKAAAAPVAMHLPPGPKETAMAHYHLIRIDLGFSFPPPQGQGETANQELAEIERKRKEIMEEALEDLKKLKGIKDNTSYCIAVYSGTPPHQESVYYYKDRNSPKFQKIQNKFKPVDEAQQFRHASESMDEVFENFAGKTEMERRNATYASRPAFKSQIGALSAATGHHLGLNPQEFKLQSSLPMHEREAEGDLPKDLKTESEHIQKKIREKEGKSKRYNAKGRVLDAANQAYVAVEGMIKNLDTSNPAANERVAQALDVQIQNLKEVKSDTKNEAYRYKKHDNPFTREHRIDLNTKTEKLVNRVIDHLEAQYDAYIQSTYKITTMQVAQTLDLDYCKKEIGTNCYIKQMQGSAIARLWYYDHNTERLIEIPREKTFFQDLQNEASGPTLRNISRAEFELIKKQAGAPWQFALSTTPEKKLEHPEHREAVLASSFSPIQPMNIESPKIQSIITKLEEALKPLKSQKNLNEKQREQFDALSLAKRYISDPDSQKLEKLKVFYFKDEENEIKELIREAMELYSDKTVEERDRLKQAAQAKSNPELALKQIMEAMGSKAQKGEPILAAEYLPLIQKWNELRKAGIKIDLENLAKNYKIPGLSRINSVTHMEYLGHDDLAAELKKYYKISSKALLDEYISLQKQSMESKEDVPNKEEKCLLINKKIVQYYAECLANKELSENEEAEYLYKGVRVARQALAGVGKGEAQETTWNEADCIRAFKIEFDKRNPPGPGMFTEKFTANLQGILEHAVQEHAAQQQGTYKDICIQLGWLKVEDNQLILGDSVPDDVVVKFLEIGQAQASARSYD